MRIREYRQYDGRRHSYPTVIRGVVRWYKDAKNAGRPKVARDRKSGYQIEQIKSRSGGLCARGLGCNRLGVWHRPVEGRIDPGQFFARVSDGTTRPMGRTRIPVVRDYHFECVPEGAKYLVRFFRA